MDRRNPPQKMNFQKGFMDKSQRKKMEFKKSLKLQEYGLFWGFFQTTNKNTDKKQNHQKQKSKQKTPFRMLANNPLFLVNFFDLHTFISAKLSLIENIKNSVFSRTQLLCITASKARFRVETPIFVVFGDFEWLQKVPFSKNR